MHSACCKHRYTYFFCFSSPRDPALSLPKTENKPRSAYKAEVTWNGEVTAREVAKKSKAHQLRVSDNVVRVSPASPIRYRSGCGGLSQLQHDVYYKFLLSCLIMLPRYKCTGTGKSTWPNKRHATIVCLWYRLRIV